MKILLILVMVASLSGCAFQAGRLNLAVGDTEASRCHGAVEVQADGSYICEGEAEIARGSGVTAGAVELVTGVVQAVIDGARAIIGGLGAGLAGVGDTDSGGDA